MLMHNTSLKGKQGIHLNEYQNHEMLLFKQFLMHDIKIVTFYCCPLQSQGEFDMNFSKDVTVVVAYRKLLKAVQNLVKGKM